MHLPFRYEELPQELHSLIRGAIESECYGTAIDTIETYIYEHGKSNPDLLGALALCLFEDALTVMVDEVIPLGERAIGLLKAARELGLPAETVKKFRAKIKRFIDRENKRQAEIISLIEQPVETLDFQQVENLAILLDGKEGQKNAEYAARLFAIAAERREQMGQNANYFHCRVALSLAKARCWAESLPKLRDIVEGKVTIPDQTPRDNGGFNCSYILLAFYRLFDYYVEQGDRQHFEELWYEARKTVRQNCPKHHFPMSWREQDRLLRVAYDWKILHICEYFLELIPLIRSPREIPLEMEELIKEVRVYVEQTYSSDAP